MCYQINTSACFERGSSFGPARVLVVRTYSKSNATKLVLVRIVVLHTMDVFSFTMRSIVQSWGHNSEESLRHVLDVINLIQMA